MKIRSRRRRSGTETSRSTAMRVDQSQRAAQAQARTVSRNQLLQVRELFIFSTGVTLKSCWSWQVYTCTCVGLTYVKLYYFISCPLYLTHCFHPSSVVTTNLWHRCFLVENNTVKYVLIYCRSVVTKSHNLFNIPSSLFPGINHQCCTWIKFLAQINNWGLTLHQQGFLRDQKSDVLTTDHVVQQINILWLSLWSCRWCCVPIGS